MKKIFIKHGVIAGIAIFSLAVATPIIAQTVRAEEVRTNTTTNTTPSTSNPQERSESPAERRVNPEERKVVAQTRLEATKLKVCQNREKTITTIMGRLSEHGQKQITQFSTIAERAEKFYTEKGKTLATYDTLVADVAAKKAAAQAAVDKTKLAGSEFKCDGDNPKGIAATFKEDLKAEDAALKAYRTSVKNLIVGIKSVQGATSSTEHGESH